MSRSAGLALIGLSTLLLTGTALADERAETLDAAADAAAAFLGAGDLSGAIGVVRFYIPGSEAEEPGRTAAERAARSLTMEGGHAVYDTEAMDDAIESFGLLIPEVEGANVGDPAMQVGAQYVLTGRLDRVDCDGRLTGTLWAADGSQVAVRAVSFPLGGVPESLRPAGWSPCPTEDPVEEPTEDPVERPTEDPVERPAEDPVADSSDPAEEGPAPKFCEGCVRGEVRIGIRGGFVVRKALASNAPYTADEQPAEGVAPATFEEGLAVAFGDLQPDTIALMGEGPLVGGEIDLDMYIDVVRLAFGWTFYGPTDKPFVPASNDFGAALVQARWAHDLMVDAGIAFPFEVLRPWAGLRLGAQFVGARGEWQPDGSGDPVGISLQDRSCAQQSCGWDMTAKGFGIGISGGLDLRIRDSLYVQVHGVFMFGPTLTEVGAGISLGWAPKLGRRGTGGL